MAITKEHFEDFDVYIEESEYQFKHIKIDEDCFYDKICEYLVDEKKINTYTSVNVDITDELTEQDYLNIYHRLIQFIDYEKIVNINNFVDPEIIKYLDENLEHENVDLRKDKWGRIGEYIFNIILDSYFSLDCVVRKFALNTSPNMSVYGIDSVHCSLKDKIIYFGESKFVENIREGVRLINKSLAEYDKQIANEYLTISNRNIERNVNFVNEVLKRNTAYTFQEFINKTGIETIGVPIFIAHAGEINEEGVFKELRNVIRNSFYGLKTNYIVISFPILNKEKFRFSFIKAVNSKLEELKNV